MDPAIFARVLRNFCRRKRFLPFDVELVSGTSFTVPHPEALVIRDGMAVFVREDGGYRAFDSASVSQVEDRDLKPFSLGDEADSDPPAEDQPS
jgi:hypothetical protein